MVSIHWWRRIEVVETLSGRRRIAIVLPTRRRGNPALRRYRRWSAAALKRWRGWRRVSGVDVSGEGVRSVVAVVDMTTTTTTTTSTPTVASERGAAVGSARVSCSAFGRLDVVAVESWRGRLNAAKEH